MLCKTSFQGVLQHRWVWISDDLNLGLRWEFGLLLAVGVPGDSCRLFKTGKLILQGWCFGLLLLGLFFSWSLRWTYENGCIAIRRIKLSFLSVQIHLLEVDWMSAGRHNNPFSPMPCSQRAARIPLAHSPATGCVNVQKRLPQIHRVHGVGLTAVLHGVQASLCFPTPLPTKLSNRKVLWPHCPCRPKNPWRKMGNECFPSKADPR